MALTDFDLVLFGGSGDLAMRKLLPALYNRDRAKDLPPTARVICVGRHEWSREEFLAEIDKSAKPHIPAGTLDESVWMRFCERIAYVSLDAMDPKAYETLVAAMRPETPNHAVTRVFYLATPPSLFATICHNLAAIARGARETARPRSRQRKADQ